MAPTGPLPRALLVAAALVLAWRVIAVNTVAYGIDGRPRTEDRPPAALAANPADASALLARARELEAGGEPGRAGEAYAAALELAPLDRAVLTQASGWLLAQDDPRALPVLFRLVAHHPVVRPRAFPILEQALPRERDRDAWLAEARRNPEWIAAFVADACGRGVDPAWLAPLAIARANSRAVTAPEASCLVARLRDADRWDEAYLLWLSLLPPERLARVGFVFNGGFEEPPTGVGFDWIPQPGAERDTGHVAETVVSLHREGRRALRVAYNGKRQAGVPVRQFLVVPPGDYRLSGAVRTDAIKALKGIQWTLRCVRKAVPGEAIATSERFVGSNEWRPFAAEVHVPPDCPGQVLQLEPAVEPGTPAFVGGVAWFDGIALERQ